MNPAIASLLQAYGLIATRVRLVAQLDCDIYRIRVCQSGVQGDAHGGDLSLRLYSQQRELAPIQAEIAWLNALAAQDLHVPRPIADQHGRYLQHWQPDPEVASRHALLLTWLPGRTHDKCLTPARLGRIGALTAQLHQISARLTANGSIRTDRCAYTPDLAHWARGDRPRTAALSKPLRALARAAAQRLTEDIESFSRDVTAFGFVHGDLHPWNIVFARDLAGAIDFSDCGWGHHALDLAASLQYLKYPLGDNHDHRAHYPGLRASLLEAYAKTHAIPPDFERQVDTYIAARMFVTLEWILDDWPSLDHRAWGPGFLRGCQAAMADYLSS